MDPRDIVVDIYTSTQVEMRMTHQPTGLSVNGHTKGSRIKLEQDLDRELENKFAAHGQ